MGLKKTIFDLLAAAGCALFSLNATAAIVTFNLDIEFTGAQQPQGPTPWITATIDDSFGGTDTVRLTMMATNLVDEESIGNWFFNFSGDATQLTFTAVDISAATVNDIRIASSDSDPALRAASDGFYDFAFDFAPPPGNFASRFTTGEQMVYDITYIAPISAGNFNLFSAPGPGGSPGPFLSAAQIQSINDPAFCDGSGPGRELGACGSGWIAAVPIPAAVWLFGSGLLGLVAVARRRRG